MTGQEVTSMVGALGFPIFLVLAGLFIFVRYIWPWFVTDQTQRRKVEAERHADYIKTYERNTQTLELLTRTFVEFSAIVKQQHEVQGDLAAANHNTLVTVIERNHGDLVERLKRIDGKIPNGFGAKPRD